MAINLPANEQTPIQRPAAEATNNVPVAPILQGISKNASNRLREATRKAVQFEPSELDTGWRPSSLRRKPLASAPSGVERTEEEKVDLLGKAFDAARTAVEVRQPKTPIIPETISTPQPTPAESLQEPSLASAIAQHAENMRRETSFRQAEDAARTEADNTQFPGKSAYDAVSELRGKYIEEQKPATTNTAPPPPKTGGLLSKLLHR
jgi:hypothetical protein